ncbi:RNA polymerase sigma factor [Pseudomonas reactans]|uniref:RNA polymerase sigma factor n=1 Tax=Pseudomonas reactans TaxID=117680 RepID=A0ABX2R6M1_9PSED|nr:RNA polymerase sigma factor [Pseudomonas reactans]NWA44546.1 RNA polymerase sigma factor [Pseudomonas reactans]NWC85050.1 RNA polymerase sigma factor [Pseudomonas reactans]NWD32882.1 RNA polymerase sigma factor [Pseudomonas reactans]NWD98719.1 RNA polymerase sigma factor [Pseudomonas reactans]NWF18037.1 RNA polymerase sigma factor [Pseudomonas reactans]
MKDSDPDVELLARIGNNEPAAVNEMVTRKLPRLLALASRILGDADEAKDVAQESFLRIWRQAARWRSGEARFDTWLHRVALNLCHDRLRRRKERPLNEDEALELADSAPPLDEQLESADRNARMAAALAALPARQREAIVLQYYQELSNIDAAALMNISVEALESLLSRARRQLRSQLADTPGLARPGRGIS